MGCKSILRHRYFQSNILVICLAVAMALGIGCAFMIREWDPDFGTNDRYVMYLSFPGELLLRMLKLIVVPVVVLSLISGVANLPLQAMGKLGWRVILYYIATTLSAVLLGILLVCTIQPGNKRTVERSNKQDQYVHPVDSILDLIRNMIPSNLFEATMKQARTRYVLNETVMYRIDDKTGENISYIKREPLSSMVQMESNPNVLGLIVFCIFLGLMIGRMREAGRPLRVFFSALSEAVIKLVRLIIWFSPIGIFFMLAAKIVAMDDPAMKFEQLAYYILTVLLGLAIHGFIILPGLYFALTRTNPYKLMLNMSQALLTALGTASSSATLPITMRCLEEKARVSRVISRFVLPVGATINMDGTALYEAVASVFIAQYNDISLSAGQIVTVSVTATLAAIGAAGVPEAGLVTMLIVLTAVGLPTDDIALIYAIDWFLDRCRTSINVWGDSVGAGIINHHVGDEVSSIGDPDDGTGSSTTGYDDKPPLFAQDIGEYAKNSDDVENGKQSSKQGYINPGYVNVHF